MATALNTQLGDDSEVIAQAFMQMQTGLWTALPAIVKSFNPTEITCEVQPAIQGKRRLPDGSVEMVNLPLLLDCPVIFPHAGGCSLTFSIKEGDECLVVFACRGIDIWWQQGGVQPPPEVRMHDLSDGFVILAPYSQPKVIPSVSTDSVQLRSDDKSAYIEIKAQSKDVNIVTTGKATIKADGGTTITSPTVTINGNLILNGSLKSNEGSSGDKGVVITGDVVADNISLKSHVHGGVSTGSSNTGTPR